MASIIRVKRSTGTTAPGSLQFGELGLTIGSGTQGNKGERLFVGDNAGNVDVVGGRYFTDLMVHAPGTVASVTNPTTASNGFVAILDQNRKVDVWNVDNLTLDGNTFSSTNSNGDINIDPNGSGEIVVPDDTFLTFGTNKDAKIEYDENGVDQLTFTGADVRINIATQSNGKDTGALIVEGGVGIEKNLNVGGNLNITGIVTFTDHIRLPDNKEIRLGDSNDLKLVHNGTDSVISNTTNDLNIINTGDDINITAADDFTLKVQGSEDAITAIGNGAVSLFFDNVNKAQTRIDGFNVDGTLETNNFVVVGVSTINGNIGHTGKFTNTGGAEIDNVGISSNIIATRSGGGNKLFIDPYPDGLSNEGEVIIKGNLQVDGTTTTVNSTSATVNDAIMRLGDVTSTRTVLTTVGSGTSTIELDSVVGINTGDVVTGSTSIPSNSSVHSYVPPASGVGLGTIFISNNTTAGIATATQLTITHAYDTNTDRGISFNYNTAAGTANTKKGFFGYNDSTGENSSAPERSFTYIPDSTVTNEVVTGTRGNLDIKGIYYQSGDFSTHGVVYFDNAGLQNSTAAPSAATFTSTQLLTAVTEIAITLGSSQSVVAGDLVTQAGGGSQQGVVKSTSNSTTVTLIGVTGTFNTSADLILNGTGTGKTPTNVSTTYTSKPMWTTTVDGGTF
tara:strand:- start:18311 stop:20335 length:2025 start_codon:yes stop_codon:yes gene_type:complete